MQIWFSLLYITCTPSEDSYRKKDFSSSLDLEILPGNLKLCSSPSLIPLAPCKPIHSTWKLQFSPAHTFLLLVISRFWFYFQMSFLPLDHPPSRRKQTAFCGLLSTFPFLSVRISLSSCFHFYHERVPPLALPDPDSSVSNIHYSFHFLSWVAAVGGACCNSFLFSRLFSLSELHGDRLPMLARVKAANIRQRQKALETPLQC